MPDSHPTQSRFLPYKRAENYITHLNKIYEQKVTNNIGFDLAVKRRLKFRSETPSPSSPYKLSQLPKNKLSPELESHMGRIKRYHSLLDTIKPVKKVKPNSVPRRRNNSNRYQIFVSEVPFVKEDEISTKPISTNRSFSSDTKTPSLMVYSKNLI